MEQERPSLRPLLLGHRGARALKSIPENSIASFDRAIADGCDGFEFDVRLTADGEAVICHDPKCGGVTIARAHAQRLSKLPRLQDILERYPKAFLDIELKVPGLESIVVDLLRRHRPAQFVASSFLPEVLMKIHGIDSTVPLGLICETKSQLRLWSELPVAYVIPNRKLLKPDLMHQFRAAGKKILVWTVNDAKGMQHFADFGVDGVISDDTQLLCRTLQR
jgi:glycerophosphoryl diester phosphodiesterase